MGLYLLFNEGTTPTETIFSVFKSGPAWIADPITSRVDLWDRTKPLRLASGEWKTIMILPK
jgi:hypothetical protein